MKEIIESYGGVLVEMFAVVGIVNIIFNCVGNGGIISEFIAKFMLTICG